jgi:antitoxin PrlF
VRSALGVEPGDEIAYAIEDGRVVLTKAAPAKLRRGAPFEDPFAAFREWDTPEDDEAFRDL